MTGFWLWFEWRQARGSSQGKRQSGGCGRRTPRRRRILVLWGVMKFRRDLWSALELGAGFGFVRAAKAIEKFLLGNFG
jgi:hypothetical protein